MANTQTDIPAGGGGIGPAGPPGPPGPQGPPGPGGVPANVFNQSLAASTWTVNHNLGYIPLTTLYTSGSVEFESEVVHNSVNQFQVLNNNPISGFVRYI
jgi:hypothetical protein